MVQTLLLLAEDNFKTCPLLYEIVENVGLKSRLLVLITCSYFFSSKSEYIAAAKPFVNVPTLKTNWR